MAQGAPELAAGVEQGHTVVADHHALVGVAVQAGIGGGVAGLENPVAQDKLAEAGGQGHFGQKCGADFALLVAQQQVALVELW